MKRFVLTTMIEMPQLCEGTLKQGYLGEAILEGPAETISASVDITYTTYTTILLIPQTSHNPAIHSRLFSRAFPFVSWSRNHQSPHCEVPLLQQAASVAVLFDGSCFRSFFLFDEYCEESGPRRYQSS